MIFFISGYIRYSTTWSVKKKETGANIIMLGRIEAHICICFTAYTIMLELERELKAAKSDITQNAQQPSHKICNFTNGQQAKGII